MNVPETLPRELEDLVADLKEAPTKDVALRKAYDVIAERFPGKRLTSYLLPWRIFARNPYTIWNKYKRLPCTASNWLLAVILVKTEWFTEEDMEFVWTTLWLTPHQFLRVNCGDHTVDLDPFCAAFGVPFGEHGKGMT